MTVYRAQTPETPSEIPPERGIFESVGDTVGSYAESAARYAQPHLETASAAVTGFYESLNGKPLEALTVSDRQSALLQAEDALKMQEGEEKKKAVNGARENLAKALDSVQYQLRKETKEDARKKLEAEKTAYEARYEKLLEIERKLGILENVSSRGREGWRWFSQKSAPEKLGWLVGGGVGLWIGSKIVGPVLKGVFNIVFAPFRFIGKRLGLVKEAEGEAKKGGGWFSKLLIAGVVGLGGYMGYQWLKGKFPDLFTAADAIAGAAAKGREAGGKVVDSAKEKAGAAVDATKQKVQEVPGGAQGAESPEQKRVRLMQELQTVTAQIAEKRAALAQKRVANDTQAATALQGEVATLEQRQSALELELRNSETEVQRQQRREEELKAVQRALAEKQTALEAAKRQGNSEAEGRLRAEIAEIEKQQSTFVEELHHQREWEAESIARGQLYAQFTPAILRLYGDFAEKEGIDIFAKSMELDFMEVLSAIRRKRVTVGDMDRYIEAMSGNQERTTDTFNRALFLPDQPSALGDPEKRNACRMILHIFQDRRTQIQREFAVLQKTDKKFRDYKTLNELPLDQVVELMVVSESSAVGAFVGMLPEFVKNPREIPQKFGVFLEQSYGTLKGIGRQEIAFVLERAGVDPQAVDLERLNGFIASIAGSDIAGGLDRVKGARETELSSQEKKTLHYMLSAVKGYAPISKREGDMLYDACEGNEDVIKALNEKAWPTLRVSDALALFALYEKASADRQNLLPLRLKILHLIHKYDNALFMTASSQFVESVFKKGVELLKGYISVEEDVPEELQYFFRMVERELRNRGPEIARSWYEWGTGTWLGRITSGLFGITAYRYLGGRWVLTRPLAMANRWGPVDWKGLKFASSYLNKEGNLDAKGVSEIEKKFRVRGEKYVKSIVDASRAARTELNAAGWFRNTRGILIARRHWDTIRLTELKFLEDAREAKDLQAVAESYDLKDHQGNWDLEGAKNLHNLAVKAKAGPETGWLKKQLKEWKITSAVDAYGPRAIGNTRHRIDALQEIEAYAKQRRGELRSKTVQELAVEAKAAPSAKTDTAATQGATPEVVTPAPAAAPTAPALVNPEVTAPPARTESAPVAAPQAAAAPEVVTQPAPAPVEAPKPAALPERAAERSITDDLRGLRREYEEVNDKLEGEKRAGERTSLENEQKAIRGRAKEILRRLRGQITSVSDQLTAKTADLGAGHPDLESLQNQLGRLKSEQEGAELLAQDMGVNLDLENGGSGVTADVVPTNPSRPPKKAVQKQPVNYDRAAKDRANLNAAGLSRSDQSADVKGGESDANAPGKIGKIK